METGGIQFIYFFGSFIVYREFSIIFLNKKITFDYPNKSKPSQLESLKIIILCYFLWVGNKKNHFTTFALVKMSIKVLMSEWINFPQVPF